MKASKDLFDANSYLEATQMLRIIISTFSVLLLVCPNALAGLESDVADLPNDMDVDNLGNEDFPAFYVPPNGWTRIRAALDAIIGEYYDPNTFRDVETEWVDGDNNERTIVLQLGRVGEDVSVSAQGLASGSVVIAIGGKGSEGASSSTGAGEAGGNGGDAEATAGNGGIGIAYGGVGGKGGDGGAGMYNGYTGGDGGQGGDATVNQLQGSKNCSGYALSGDGGEGGVGGTAEAEGGSGGWGGASGEAWVDLSRSVAPPPVRDEDFATYGEATSGYGGIGGKGGNGGDIGGQGGKAGFSASSISSAFQATAHSMGGRYAGGGGDADGADVSDEGGDGGQTSKNMAVIALGGTGLLFDDEEPNDIASTSWCSGGRGADGGAGGDADSEGTGGNGGVAGGGSDWLYCDDSWWHTDAEEGGPPGDPGEGGTPGGSTGGEESAGSCEPA